MTNEFERVASHIAFRLMVEAGKDCDKWEILRDELFNNLKIEDGYSDTDARKIMKMACVGF